MDGHFSAREVFFSGIFPLSGFQGISVLLTHFLGMMLRFSTAGKSAHEWKCGGANLVGHCWQREG